MKVKLSIVYTVESETCEVAARQAEQFLGQFGPLTPTHGFRIEADPSPRGMGYAILRSGGRKT